MRRVPVLDGWRAVAIVMVVIHHAAKVFYLREADADLSVTRFGAFGVDVFFGLSGLLITSLLLQGWRESQSFRLPEFYIRRAFRILPPCLLFMAVYTALGFWKSNLELASCLLFFRNYVPTNLTGPGSAHLWSLAVEEHFYMLWPGLLAFVATRKSKETAKNITAGLALSFAVWRMIESQLSTPLFSQVPAHFRTDLRLDALLWGCVAAFLLDSERDREKLAKQLRLPVWTGAAAILVLSVKYYSPLTSVWVAVLIPVALAGTLVHPEWKISKVLGWGPLTWLGRISYSLYLWQQIFFAPGWENAPQVWRQWPWNLLGAFAVSIASYYLVETPLIAVGRKLAAKYTSKREAGVLSEYALRRIDLQVEHSGEHAQT